MQPNLDEIQQALNKATQQVLEVSRGIAQWGQVRFRMPEKGELQKHDSTIKGKIQKLHYKHQKEDSEGTTI